MLIRHLSYFVTLAKERHFARAAEACRITQPTLSAAIRKLEDDLGGPLVERGHRYIGLTGEGEKLLVWGRQILSDYQSLREELTGSRQGLTGTMRLGVIPAALPCVTFLTERFCAANPAATVDVRFLPARSIAEGLDAYELDGGVTYLENEPIAHVQRIPLYHERYKLVVDRSHPFAERSAVTWHEAADQKLCLLSHDMQDRRIIDRLAKSIGLAIHPEIVTNSFLAVYAHVQQGKWASIMPHSFLHVLPITPNLAAIDLVEPAHTEPMGLVISGREPRSPMTSALLNAALETNIDAAFAAF